MEPQRFMKPDFRFYDLGDSTRIKITLSGIYTLRNKGSDRVPIGTLGFSFSLRVLIENLLGF